MSLSRRQRRFDASLRRRAVAAAAAASTCAAQATYHFESIYVNAPGAPVFAARIEAGARRRRQRDAGDGPREGAGDSRHSDRGRRQGRAVAVAGRARARVRAATSACRSALHDKAGNDWLPTDEIIIRRSYHYDDTERLARQIQENRLVKEMQTEAVQQIVRRLQAAHNRPRTHDELRADDLPRHLAERVAPLYVIHGDEPLLALEAGDAVRAAAREAGCDERETLIAEQHFKWDAFLAANASIGLFGNRKLVDLRIPSGKPGVEGGAALGALRGRPQPRQRDAGHAAAPRWRDAEERVVHRADAQRGDRRRAAGRARRSCRAGSPRASRASSNWRRRRRSSSSPSCARATCSPHGRRSTSWACCCRPASFGTTTSSRRCPTSRASTCSRCRRRGSTATPRVRCASCRSCSRKASR